MARIDAQHEYCALLTTEEPIAHLEQYVTKFRLPSEIVWLDALPKGSTGKILKGVLRNNTNDSG